MNILCRTYNYYSSGVVSNLHMLDVEDAYVGVEIMNGKQYHVLADTSDGRNIAISPLYDTELEAELMILDMFETGVLLDLNDPVMRTWCARPVSTKPAINRTNGECMRDIHKSLWGQEIMDGIAAIDKQKAAKRKAQNDKDMAYAYSRGLQYEAELDKRKQPKAEPIPHDEDSEDTEV